MWKQNATLFEAFDQVCVLRAGAKTTNDLYGELQARFQASVGIRATPGLPFLSALSTAGFPGTGIYSERTLKHWEKLFDFPGREDILFQVVKSLTHP